MAAYDKNKDYTDLIQKAVASGDLFAAAQYEQQLNAKIDGEGLPYQKQNNYTDYLGSNPISGNYNKDIDYTAAIQKAAASGDITSAAGLEKELNAKILGEGLPYRTVNKYTTMLTEKKQGANPVKPYQSKYSDAIDKLVSGILNGTYSDFQNSGEYKSLADEYAAKGKQAMQDTVGDVSARTGGLASSYAVTAGQQADNAYMQQLQTLARQMYADKQSQDYNKLNMLSGLDSTDYGRYRDTVSDARYNDETTYNRQQTQQQWDYQQQQDADKKAKSIAETMAGIGDFSGLKAMGYTDDQIQELTDAFTAQQAAAAAKAAKSSSGGSGSGSSGKSKITSDIISKVKAFADDGDNSGMEKYLENMQYAGKLSQDDADYLYSQYTTEKSPAPDVLSEAEFNRSSAMQQKYGTYQNYYQAVMANYGG